MRTAKTTCDFCGKHQVGTAESGWHSPGDPTAGWWEIRRHIGSGTYTTFHACPDCDSLVMEFLKKKEPPA